MGNKTSSPFPTYESACNHLNPMEISHLKKSFKHISHNSETVTLSSFSQVRWFYPMMIPIPTERLLKWISWDVQPARSCLLFCQTKFLYGIMWFQFRCDNESCPESSSIMQQHCTVAAPSSQYIRKHVLPRLFAAMDTKRDHVIDFEEYVCAVALFRIGSTEDKIKSE